MKTVDASGTMYEYSDDSESQINVDKNQKESSDFIEIMDSEMYKLKRRLTQLREQRENIKSTGLDKKKIQLKGNL